MLNDKTGAPVTISIEERSPIGAYTVHLADGTLAGRADFVDGPRRPAASTRRSRRRSTWRSTAPRTACCGPTRMR